VVVEQDLMEEAEEEQEVIERLMDVLVFQL
jgi:hypothetical protein